MPRFARDRAWFTAAILLAAGLSVVAGGVAGAGSVAASAAGVVHVPAWQKVILEPGARAPVKEEFAAFFALSCPSPGNCLAGGYFTPKAAVEQAFTVSERNGVWQAPAQLRGISAVSPHGGSQITAVACGSAGNCVVGGTYPSGLGYQLPFVDREVAGRWQVATKVPGIAPRFDSEVTSASCGGVGNCLVGGYYYDKAGQHAFLLPETRGAWQTAYDVPGIDSLNTGSFAQTSALSCKSAGTCVAGGYYTTIMAPGDVADFHDFVVSEVNGVWAPPVTLTGSVTGPVTSVSCSSAGNCTAALGLLNSSAIGLYSYDWPAAATERNGSWGPAVRMRVPGTGNAKFDVGATSVACAGGACAVGGSYWAGSAVQAFVADETGGVWHAAVTFPAIAKLNLGRNAQITTIACASAGNCVAAGSFLDRSNDTRPFLVSQAHGRWGAPFAVPGLPGLRAPAPASAAITALACPATGRCASAGWYSFSWKLMEGFVGSQR